MIQIPTKSILKFCATLILTVIGVVPMFSQTAADNKARLLNYLNEIYGKKVLSGQMNLTWYQGIDMVNRVYKITGKYPALQGFDFMNATDRKGAYTNPDNQTQLAIDWWTNAKGQDKHGIVTFCWHWRDPTRLTDQFYANNYKTVQNKGTKNVVDASLKIPMKGDEFDAESDLGKRIKSDLDVVSAELLVLKKAGVPVLWRPLHEGGGSGENWDNGGENAWFWWGAFGAKAYKALYIYMYKYFTLEKGLDNLIWVWNGQDVRYYPGDEYVDITGWDLYTKGDTGSQMEAHKKLLSIAPKKPTALTEVGTIPSPDKFETLLGRPEKYFLWFMVWNDGNSKDPENNFWSGNFKSEDNSTNYPWNGKSYRSNVYQSPAVVTLDELPDLSRP